MYNIDTDIFMGVYYTLYVYFCNPDNIVNGYIFSNDIFVFLYFLYVPQKVVRE